MTWCEVLRNEMKTAYDLRKKQMKELFKTLFDGVNIETTLKVCEKMARGMGVGCLAGRSIFTWTGWYERIMKGNSEKKSRWLTATKDWLLSQLLLGDNMALVAESAKQLQCLVTEFGRVCKGRKLRVNVKKARGSWDECGDNGGGDLKLSKKLHRPRATRDIKWFRSKILHVVCDKLWSESLFVQTGWEISEIFYNG